MDKKAISPLMSTLLLVVFAILLGSLVMSWGKGYMTSIGEKPADNAVSETCNPADQLQIRFINGEITEQQYADMKAKISKT